MDIYNEKNLEIVQKLNTEEEISCDYNYLHFRYEKFVLTSR